MKNLHVDPHDEINVFMKSIECSYNQKQRSNRHNSNRTKVNSMKVKSTQRHKKIFSRKRRNDKKSKNVIHIINQVIWQKTVIRKIKWFQNKINLCWNKNLTDRKKISRKKTSWRQTVEISNWTTIIFMLRFQKRLKTNQMTNIQTKQKRSSKRSIKQKQKVWKYVRHSKKLWREITNRIKSWMNWKEYSKAGLHKKKQFIGNKTLAQCCEKNTRVFQHWMNHSKKSFIDYK